MKNRTTMERAFAPRWTWRATLLAAGVTGLLFFGLPSLETLSHPPEKSLEVRTVKTVDVKRTYPPSTRPTPRTNPNPAKPSAPKPKLERARRSLSSPRSSMNLNVKFDVAGVGVSVDEFAVFDDELNESPLDLVFELGELDEKPRALSRLKPMYPHQAKARKIEGFVVIDFVVARDGTPREIEVRSEQPASVFTRAAIDAVARWRFTPGVKNGAPVAARVRQTVRFNLK